MGDSDHLRNFLISFLNTKKDNKQEKRLGKSKSTINNSLRKIGATLYFHEHVIVIYRLTQRIDSAKNMPQYKRKRYLMLLIHYLVQICYRSYILLWYLMIIVSH